MPQNLQSPIVRLWPLRRIRAQYPHVEAVRFQTFYCAGDVRVCYVASQLDEKKEVPGKLCNAEESGKRDMPTLKTVRLTMGADQTVVSRSL